MGKVVVVAGFQGIDEMGNITTLGRGGSDLTAVALAAALNADECQIYTDIDGVYTTDPKIVLDACKMSQMTVEEMLEMASNGAKVMQARAVEFAGQYHVPVRVLSTFEEGPGTLITNERNMQHPIVSGVTSNLDEAKLVIQGIPDSPGVIASVLKPLSEAHIEVDMIVQSMARDATIDLAFTVHKRDVKLAFSILENISGDLGAQFVMKDEHVAKLSLVGMGMRSHAGVASQMFQILGKEGINIQLISTSEIKISVIIDEKCLTLGVRALHDAFQLGTMEREIATSCLL
jgi:aspartate kinase